MQLGNVKFLKHKMHTRCSVCQCQPFSPMSLRDHVKPALKQLHWLPVEQRITYKLSLFMHHIHTGQAPQYLSDCVSTVSALSGRYRLR